MNMWYLPETYTVRPVYYKPIELQVTYPLSSTEVSCKRDGHDIVEGTALGILYCRKCGRYFGKLEC